MGKTGYNDLADAISVGIFAKDMANTSDSTASIYTTGTGIDYSKINSLPNPAGPWTTTRENHIFDKEMIEKILNMPAKGDSLAGKFVTKRTLKYKGITFIVNLEEEAMEFFEDPKNISKEELQVLNVTFPEYYKRIESVWTDAYIKVQAKKVFESD
jgi:hypothetical protein